MGLVNLSILVERIKKKLSGDFVSKTDYASASSGGVIKLDSTYATDITSGGKLKAKEISASDYASANDSAFISKGTLDNVLESMSGGGLTKLYERDSESPIKLNSGITLAESSVNYPALLVMIRGATGGYTGKGWSFFIPTFAQGINNGTYGVFTDMSTSNTLTRLQMKLEGTALSASYSDTDLEWYAVYGIK